MKGAMKRYNSDRLEDGTSQRALEGTPLFLREVLGDIVISATYEFGCNLHDELLYRPMKVGTRWLDRFIHGSLEQGIVVPGQSDFRIVVGRDRLDALFCHEGDIHLEGKDEALVDGLRISAGFEGVEFTAIAIEEE